MITDPLKPLWQILAIIVWAFVLFAGFWIVFVLYPGAA